MKKVIIGVICVVVLVAIAVLCMTGTFSSKEKVTPVEVTETEVPIEDVPVADTVETDTVTYESIAPATDTTTSVG